MARGPEDEPDQQRVDRDFAELVAGYHLTADRGETSRPQPAVRAEPVEGPEPAPETSEPSPAVAEAGWGESHPLFRFEEPPAPPVLEELEPDEPYVPEPLPPLARPAIPALLGWSGIGVAVLVVLGATLGAPIPAWLGWIAVGCFLSGFGILILRLPRHRPPDAGNGAVL